MQETTTRTVPPTKKNHLRNESGIITRSNTVLGDNAARPCVSVIAEMFAFWFEIPFYCKSMHLLSLLVIEITYRKLNTI